MRSSGLNLPQPVPETRESLYIGIDVGKLKHLAGFLSTTLLQRHGRFEACPVLTFEHSRQGFRALAERIRTYAPLEQSFCVLEQTGHYHYALQQYLQELEIPVYVMHVQKRPTGLLKTDKRDALNLANTLYTQLELGAQVAESLHLVRRALPPSETAAQLKGLMRHRYELSHECTQRKNKLTALCDELFPELSQVLKDPNSVSALTIREHFPTAHAVANAELDDLRRCRCGRHPSDAHLCELQRLARHSIGVTAVQRVRGLVFEQAQLITELRLLQQHQMVLEAEVGRIIAQSREGQILTSVPGIGTIAAATLIATIGTIANFPSAATLKSYCGWVPSVVQSGRSVDRVSLTPKGSRPLKSVMYLVVLAAITTDCEWAHLYKRLLPAKCRYDERTGRYVGKGKVIGRIAGQIIGLIYMLLRKDYELLARLPPGAQAPGPTCYDPETHKRHRNGEYTSTKRRGANNVLVLHGSP